jgi:hypothetical protein
MRLYKILTPMTLHLMPGKGGRKEFGLILKFRDKLRLPLRLQRFSMKGDWKTVPGVDSSQILGP